MKPRTLIALIAIAVITLNVSTGLIAQTPANPVPFINQPLVPDAAKPGGNAFTLTVNGTQFVSGATVNWNGSARPTTFVSASKLTASIVASDIATAKTASVTVVNPGPGGGTSNVAFLGVTLPTSSVALAANSYGTANRSYSVAVGDFNRDGKLDLVVADYDTNSVSVLLGNGDGTFQVHVEYTAEAYPSFVAVGDFNGDGKLDLAVENDFSSTTSVLLGNGDGTFQPAVNYNVGGGSLAVGDFNRDGKLDLLVTNGSNNINVLLGNGDGTFQPAYSAGSVSGSVVVGDFNRDGKLDLAVANNASNEINVLLGNGDGTFQPAVSYSTGPAPTSVAVADFNADGKLDLVVATNGNASNNTVSILLGNGDGTFQAHVDYQTGSSNPASVAVGDFNGDGKLDLVVADLFSTDVRLLLGNGDGTFGTAASYAAGSEPSSVAVGDFNGDGRLDVAVADSSSATVSVLLSVPSVSLSKTSLAFPNQLVGTTSASQTLKLTNGGLPLRISSIAVTGTNATNFSQVNNCDSGLGPGANCTITVTFTPTQIGPGNASITITDDAEGSPQVIPLTGTGLSPVSLSNTVLNFAAQVVGISSAPQRVTLTNIGAQPLSISTIAVTGMNASDFIPAHTCGSSLAAGASCIISAVFKPTQIRPRTAAISITDSAGDSPQTVALSGTGVFSGPNATLSGTSLTFATQLVGGTTPAQSITLINYGAATLSIASIGIKGVNPSDFAQTNTCGSLVAPTGSCTISVTFKPTQRGSRAASLSLMDNAPGSLQTVSLSGTATVVEFNPASLSFGVVQPAQSKNLSTTLTNTGPGTLSIAGITLIGTDADEFSQVHTCGSIVGAGQSCTISVTFTPKEGGTDNAALSISDNGGGSPQQVSLSGSGKVVQQYVCNCGGPCNYFCTLIRRCGCHYTPSSGALLELEEERSSRVSCNANWSDRLPEFRERY